ncbi:transcription factor IIIB 70 kDa subunit [Trichomonascus vanleenenianus]|uniref:transcription factor TFIIIB subunit BRF1 n=1 Tax=Trichomonascus vanleenenianus TaxID=2268995 RepID=UPI003ECAAA94
MAQCPNCGPTTVYTDPSSNEVICTQCSSVLEESRIVSEITFGESSSGAAIVTGTFVGADQSGAGTGGLYGQQGESRAQTLDKARNRINKIAHKLEISEPIAQMAMQFYKLALNSGFVKGRRSQYVVSACLYVACRRNKAPHMLMDFAEAIYVNVFKIGSTYLQLLKVLGIFNLPIIDPSIFIQRFANRLGLDQPRQRKVMEDANKVAYRMNRDWIVQGRRPAGVVAACVLMALRMNNIRRSKAEIVQIAKISEETIQRRLDELKNTAAGSMTVAEFRESDIQTQADPPSFLKHRRLERKLEKLRAEREKLRAAGELEEAGIEKDAEIEEILKEIEELRNNPRPRVIHIKKEEEDRITNLRANKNEEEDVDAITNPEKAKEYDSEAKENEDESDAEVETTEAEVKEKEDDAEVKEKEDESDAEVEKVRGETKIESDDELAEEDRAELGSGVEKDEELKQESNGEANVIDGTAKEEEVTDGTTKEEEVTNGAKKEESDKIDFTENLDEDVMSEDELMIVKVMESTLADESVQEAERIQALLRHYDEERKNRELGLMDEQQKSSWVSKVPDHPENLSDVDDDEIDSVILNKQESEAKKRVWMTLNRDYLIEQKNKQLRIEADKRAGVYKAPRKRKKKNRDPSQAPASAAESAKKMLATRAFSKRLNYAAVDELFKKD